MSYDSKTEEYSPDHAIGTWVTAPKVRDEGANVGIVFGFDEDDGQYQIAYFRPASAKANESPRSGGCCWAEHETVEAAPTPSFATTAPEHVFVIDWLDDGEPNFEVIADPAAVVGWLEGAEYDVPDNLQLRLMECVSDPGERLSLNVDELHVRFVSVVGAER